jgi:cellulose biosynthesis protein BcsQ
LQGASDPRVAVRTTAYRNLEVLPAEVLYDSADVDLDAAKKSRRRVERVVQGLQDDYDLVVIHAPPGLSLLSANIVHAVDVILVPIVPSPLSLRTLDQVVEFLGTVDERPPGVMAFLSMVDRRRALHRDITERLGDRYDDVAKTVIPASATVERMGQRRAPIGAWAGSTAAAGAYRELWAEVRPRLRLPG